MKQLLFCITLILFFSEGRLNAQAQSAEDSTHNSLYFVYNETAERDSLVHILGIDRSIYKYPAQKPITYIPLVSEFSMYKDGDEDKFRFLFNDPHYQGTKKIASIILQGVNTEAKLINEIQYITLDRHYVPLPSGNFMPIFPGGYRSMISYLNDNFPAHFIEKNKEAIDNHPYLVVCFIVEKDGTLNNIKIIDSCNADLDYKAYDLIRNMPKWITSPQTGSKPIFIAMQLIFNKEP